MTDQVRTIIKEKQFTAEGLDKIRRSDEHQNEDIGTALEDTGQKLESPHFLPHVVDVAPARNISISDKEKVETKMKKPDSLIDKRPTLKLLKHVKRKKLMEKVHHHDKDITELFERLNG